MDRDPFMKSFAGFTQLVAQARRDQNLIQSRVNAKTGISLSNSGAFQE
jgi:hypothetical protein